MVWRWRSLSLEKLTCLGQGPERLAASETALSRRLGWMAFQRPFPVLELYQTDHVRTGCCEFLLNYRMYGESRVLSWFLLGVKNSGFCGQMRICFVVTSTALLFSVKPTQCRCRCSLGSLSVPKQKQSDASNGKQQKSFSKNWAGFLVWLVLSPHPFLLPSSKLFRKSFYFHKTYTWFFMVTRNSLSEDSSSVLKPLKKKLKCTICLNYQIIKFLGFVWFQMDSFYFLHNIAKFY